MIEIKPNLYYQSRCPYCHKNLQALDLLWLGMDVCLKARCGRCAIEIVEHLRTGHTLNRPYQVDLKNNKIFGEEATKAWLGEILLSALQHPQPEVVKITKEVFRLYKKVIILNCIDYLYGHSLLKLLNTQRHLEQDLEYGLVVIIQPFLRWMVPQGVAEIWNVAIPLKQGKNYYPSFNQWVTNELNRFDEVQISKAYSHPKEFDITQFTGVLKHDLTQETFKVTFVWREDRLWCNDFLYWVCCKLNLAKLLLHWQNWKIEQLLYLIRIKAPHATFAIAGLGKNTKFSDWIEDFRVEQFDKDAEQRICKVYSETRLVIGIHGSNMLLPSGHSGMVIDLMPENRWGNFAQDILYQEQDPRIAAFRYRYLPLNTPIRNLANIAASMLSKWKQFNKSMLNE